jgi:hypothetical protein
MIGTIDDYFRLLETLRKGGSPILKPETARLIAENAVGDIPVAQAGEWPANFRNSWLMQFMANSD